MFNFLLKGTTEKYFCLAAVRKSIQIDTPQNTKTNREWWMEMSFARHYLILEIYHSAK